MGQKEHKEKKLKDLRKGDIIRMRIPFEENTSDYYNGYKPKEIRGQWYKDRNGDVSKPRFVIVIGHDDSNIMYLPMTSRHSRFDSKHQYVLQDNSMTWKREEDMKSYVEVSSLRAVYADPEWNIQYMGKVADNDMVNIMVKLGKREIDFGSKRDQRAYVSQNREASFKKCLEDNGYVLSSEDCTGKVYSKEDGRTVTRSRWGLVKYHVPLSKEEVAKMVAKREERYVDDFVQAVANLKVDKESEAGI